MRRLLPVGIVVTAMLGLALASPASASHSWGTYHWGRTANPFTLSLGDNVSSTWDSYLATTSADWSVSTVLDTTVVPGTTTGRQCRPRSGRVEVCNASYGSNGWLGLAQIWLSGSHISQGTAKMNDTYFSRAPYNTPAERNHVMCQEVGHTFGLGHQDESGAALGTCMDYSQDPGSQHPNQHDYDQLVTIYSHLDSVNTVGGAARPSASGTTTAAPVGDSPASWGQEVARAANGRSSVFVRHLDSAHSVVTVVTWATRG